MLTSLSRTFNVQRQKWGTPKLADENMIVNTTDEEGAVSVAGTGSQVLFTRCRYDKNQSMGAHLLHLTGAREAGGLNR